MAYAPKSGAPAFFSLAQAFAAAISGDATWGWLADWLPLISDAHYDTAEFCAAGPIITAALNPLDFFPTFNPRDPRQLLHTAELGALLTAAARDRVFGAYCEIPSPVGSFATDVCQDQNNAGGGWGNTVIWTVPAGATQARVKTSAASGTWDIHVRYDPTGVAGEPVGGAPAGILFTNNTIWTTSYTTFAVSGGEVYSISNSGHGTGQVTVCVGFNVGASGTPYSPTAQPQPTGVSSPLGTVDPSLTGIASEVERLEFKLDNLLSIIQAIAGATLDLGAPPDDPEALPTNTPKDIGDAVGCIIEVSGIPPSRSLDFGTPQNIVKLAHVNLGSANGWYPSLWLTHTPMVIRPFPPGTTQVTVTDLTPPATATIRLIPREK